MLLAHMSDVHIGAKKYGERVIYEDIFRAFEESLEAVKREHAEVLVISGDFFDSPHPDNTTLVRALKLIKNFASHGIKVVAAHGEHDTPGRREHSLLSLMSEAIEGFYAPTLLGAGSLTGPQLVDLTTVKLNGVAFMVYPFFKVSIDERRELYRRLGPLYDSRARELRKDGVKSVFVAHMPVDPVFPFTDETVTSVRSFPRVNYVALGHIHKREINYEKFADGNLWYAYPGSLYPLDIKEARETHKRGPLLIDLSSEEATVSEVPVTVREHYVIPLTVKEPSSVYYDLKSALSKVVKSPNYQPLVHLDITALPGIPTRLIEAEANRIAKELNLILIPHITRAADESTGLPKGEAKTSIDIVKMLQEIVGDDEFTAKVVLELAAAAAEGEEEAVDSALEKLTSWPKSLEILRRLTAS